MELVITMQEYGDDYENELTKEMDCHLTDQWLDVLSQGYVRGTYICKNDIGEQYLGIRFPGATRGHVEVDVDMVIQDIVLYEDTCFGKVGCYKTSVTEVTRKYIGSKIVIN